MIRLALACLATSLLTLALAAGLGIEPTNALADGPRPPVLIQPRPISEAVGSDGLPNLGVWRLPGATQAARAGVRQP